MSTFVVLALAAVREALRLAYLGRFGFSPLAHRVTLDWGRVSIGLLIGWIVVVAGLGVVVTLRNRGL